MTPSRSAGDSASPDVLVSAPMLKFAIGAIASLCAVLIPRLLAALAQRDPVSVTFITPEFAGLAAAFSGLVGLVVTILEWRVPRAPFDTFMTTLGVPAILAGALSANQNAGALQEKTQKANELVDALSKETGIAIESPKTSPTDTGRQGAWADVLIRPVYAANDDAALRSAEAQPPFAIRVNQPRYLIVLDRAATQQDAETKASQLTQRFAAVAPGQPLSTQVQRQGAEFLVVVAGGARIKADAILEAVRVKNTYHLTPTLVQATTY